jgi:uncharacterized Rmd1/YagE family protein
LIHEVSDNQYPKELINDEKEIMNFIEVSTTSTLSNDIIKLNRQSETEHLLDKYAFSNALALSVKLGRINFRKIIIIFEFFVFINRNLGNFTR